MNRAALAATAQLCVDRDGDREWQRMRWSQAWPVVLRRTGEDRVHLVHGAGGPLGGDEFGLGLEVGPGARLRVGSAAATLVQPGRPAPARWTVRAALEPGGSLVWAPEPTVVCAGAELESALRVQVGAEAVAVLREVVVLGRHGEAGGGYRGTLTVDVGGRRVLAHRTVLDGADPVLCGPAGTAGARAVGTLVVAGGQPAAAPPAEPAAGERPGLRWAWTGLDGPGRMLLAVGDPRAVVGLLERAVADHAPPPRPRVAVS